MGADEFTKIILSELGQQDPLAPNDTNQLIQQISDIRGIQSDMDLSDRLKALVGQDEFASAAGLMGKSVSGISLENDRVQGRVVGVSRTSSGARLQLEDGTRLDFANVDELVETVASEEGGT
jgi:flagellar basal-body rod modification protein FlgD